MRTTEEIYKTLTENFARAGGTAVAEGGDMALRLYAVAAEIFSLEAQADFVARQSFPQTADGVYLDRHAELRGLQRGAACKAKGALKFYIESSRAVDLVIPVGTECRTAAGIGFVTTEAGTIAAGSTFCTVAAEAVEPGSGGNVPINSITFMILPPAGVENVVNATAFTGGTNAENDEALRKRVLMTYRRLPNGANAAYYESCVLSYPGVAAAVVLPKNRGVGTVDVIFSVDGGLPSDAQVAEVQKQLEKQREICVDLQVRAPSARPVDVFASLMLSDGYQYEAVAAAAEAVLRASFSGKLLGKPVYRAKLQALLMSVEGVENCVLSAPTVDFAGAVDVLPVLRELNISEAV